MHPKVFINEVNTTLKHTSTLYSTMKHRITYLHDPSEDDDFDPRQTLKVWKKSMRVSELVAAKEHRVTFSIGELPVEVCVWCLLSLYRILI